MSLKTQKIVYMFTTTKTNLNRLVRVLTHVHAFLKLFKHAFHRQLFFYTYKKKLNFEQTATPTVTHTFWTKLKIMHSSETLCEDQIL